MTLDLQSLLPRLLPGAIAWAEAQSQRAAAAGRSLDDAGLALARSVGVRRPERIRMLLVDRLPFPEEPILRQAAMQTGLLGFGMVGLTLGYSIFLVEGHETPRLLSHECRHVHQYEALGSIPAFLSVYLDQIVRFGYDDAPLERDARAGERNFA
jgi:hypothetical protein